MVSINTTIEQIPAAQRTKVISTAVPYLENITNGYLRASILLAISLIPEEQRSSDLINTLVALFQRHHRCCIEESYLRGYQADPGSSKSRSYQPAKCYFQRNPFR